MKVAHWRCWPEIKPLLGTPCCELIFFLHENTFDHQWNARSYSTFRLNKFRNGFFTVFFSVPRKKIRIQINPFSNTFECWVNWWIPLQSVVRCIFRFSEISIWHKFSVFVVFAVPFYFTRIRINKSPLIITLCLIGTSFSYSLEA